MTFREIFARVTGSGTRVSSQEAELRRLSEAGETARRSHEPDRALQIYQDGLERARSTNFPQGQEVFLGLIGALHTEQGRYEQADQALEEALMLAKQSGQNFRKARALLNLGAYHLTRGNLTQAQQLLEEALELSRKANDLVATGLALGNLADIYLKQNNPAYALRLLKEAAPQVVQNPSQAAYLMGRMGQAHLAIGETERGRKCFLQAIGLAEQNHQPEQELKWSNVLADHLYKEGMLGEALRYYQRVDALAQDAGNLTRDAALHNLLNQGIAYQRIGENAKALDCIQRALDAARAAGNPELEASALSTLGNVQKALDHPDEAMIALNSAIALYETRVQNPAERINTMLAIGTLYQDQNQGEQALAILEQALTVAGSEDHVGRAQTLRRIGSILQKQDHLQMALEKWLEALNLFETSGETAQAARLLCDIAALRRSVSGITAALPDYERATTLLTGVKDASTRGLVLSNVANLYTDLGEIETAQSFYQESIQLARQIGNHRAEALRLGNFGWYHIVTGKPQEGIKYIDQALLISRQLNDQVLIAVQTSNLALAYHELGNYFQAEEFFRDAIALADRFPESRWGAMFRSNLGRTLTAEGKLDRALPLLEGALPISRAVGDQETAARTLARLADVYLRQGRLQDSDSAAREAETMARKWGYRKGQADALTVRAGIAKAQNDRATQITCLTEAQKLYTILHDPVAAELARMLEILGA